jgi:hypothetical protein
VTVLEHMLDELEKISGARMSPTQMLAHLRRLNPLTARGLTEVSPTLLEDYRSALRRPTTVSVPLKTRLESFKQWKRTGELPSLSLGWSGGTRVARGLNPHNQTFRYSRSSEPITVYSGAGEDTLREAVRNPRSGLHTSVLIPGKTDANLVGLYASPDQTVANAYARRGQGAPAVAGITLPRRYVPIGSGGEAMVPLSAESLAKSQLAIKRLP